MIKLNLSFKHWLIVAVIFLLSAGSALAASRAVRTRSSCSRTAPSPNVVVALLHDHADPSAVSVPIGSYVQFNSCDGLPHNVGQGAGDDQIHQAAHQDEHDHTKGGLESGIFKPDEGYRLQFKQAGVYHFHDHLNPKISITIVAYDPSVK